MNRRDFVKLSSMATIMAGYSFGDIVSRNCPEDVLLNFWDELSGRKVSVYTTENPIYKFSDLVNEKILSRTTGIIEKVIDRDGRYSAQVNAKPSTVLNDGNARHITAFEKDKLVLRTEIDNHCFITSGNSLELNGMRFSLDMYI